MASGGGESEPEKYAWVALVMGLDLAYVGAALVLASSLKRRSVLGELVVMVTPDVGEGAVAALGSVFDKVVRVEYLQTLALQKYSERFDAMYNYWLDKCFTKFAVFSLTEYSKVVFLDADMLAVGNPDELFSLPPPAGICSAVREVGENGRLHGNRLPRGAIEESLRNGQGRYGVRGCLLLVKPDMENYNKIRGIVEGVDRYGDLDSMVGPDEYLITRFFVDKWSHVHAKYGWVSWADREDLGVDPVFLHYVSQKPWDEGEEWDDFRYWKEEAGELVKSRPKTLCYFGRLINDIGKMAGVEATPEVLRRAEGTKPLVKCQYTPIAVVDAKYIPIREFKEISHERRIAEKVRREESALALGVDLTSSSTPGVMPRGGMGGIRRAPGTSRGAGITPRNSAASSISSKDQAEGNGGLIVKANSNILVVHNYKRPFPSKSKEEKSPANSGAHTPRQTSPPSVSPPAVPGIKGMVVPRLNLATLNAEDNTSQAEGSGGKTGKTWMADHWRKRHGGDPDTHRSAADLDDNWRAPSARAHPEPEEAVQPKPDAQNSGAVPQSARSWQPPAAPVSARGQGPPRSARSGFYQRWDNPPVSSRADQVGSWRSTPRDAGDSADSWRTNEDHQGKGQVEHYNGHSQSTGPSGADHGAERLPAKDGVYQTPRNRVPNLNLPRFSPRDFRHDPPAIGPYSARHAGNGQMSPARGRYRRDGGMVSPPQGPPVAEHQRGAAKHGSHSARGNGSIRYSAGGKEGGHRGAGKRDGANRAAGNRGTYGNFDRREYKGYKGDVAGPNSRDWTSRGSAGMSDARN